MAFNYTAHPSNADPAAQLMGVLETMLTAHANWQLVESNLVLSTGTAQVWRNLAAGNLHGQDWFLTINKYSATEVRFQAGEAYTPSGGVAANARLIRTLKHDQAATQTPNADGSWGVVGGYPLSDNGGNVVYYNLHSLPTTGYESYVVLSNNYLRAGVRVAANDSGVELGLFDTLLPGAPGPVEPFPLYGQSTGVNNASASHASVASSGSWSRHPNLPDTTARAFLFSFAWNTTGETVGPLLGGIGSTEADRFQGAGSILYGVPTMQTRNAPRSTFGFLRGRYRDMISVGIQPNSRLGDEWTLAGETYIAWLLNNVRVWIKKAVA